jgi:hypothetical protein
MATVEVPRDRWSKFFDDFSRQHEGWIVSIEVLGSEIGDQEEATSPLVGISADLKDKESRITVMTGDGRKAHLTHIVNTPTRVWFREPEESAHEALEIESADGTKTLLRFSHRS